MLGIQLNLIVLSSEAHMKLIWCQIYVHCGVYFFNMPNDDNNSWHIYINIKNGSSLSEVKTQQCKLK